MTPEVFEKIVEDRFRICKETLLKKNKEYARGGDRLHNFKSAARITGESPEKVLWGMLVKHVVSVQDIVNDSHLGKPIPIETLDEKLTDWINYALLLESLVREKAGRK